MQLALLWLLLIRPLLCLNLQNASYLLLHNFTLLAGSTALLFVHHFALLHQVLSPLYQLVLVAAAELGFEAAVEKVFVVLFGVLFVLLFECLVVSLQKVLLNEHPLQLLPQKFDLVLQ